MRSFFVFLLLLFFNIVLCQSKRSFYEEELSKETLFISELAEKIVNKKDSIFSINLQFMRDSLGIKNKLRKFEKEIETFEKEIDFYIDKKVFISKNKLYTIHFFILENEEQFSKIYFLFKPLSDKNLDDFKIEEIKIDNREVIQRMKIEWYNQNGDFNIPPPPLPPSNN